MWCVAVALSSSPLRGTDAVDSDTYHLEAKLLPHTALYIHDIREPEISWPPIGRSCAITGWSAEYFTHFLLHVENLVPESLWPEFAAMHPLRTFLDHAAALDPRQWWVAQENECLPGLLAARLIHTRLLYSQQDESHQVAQILDSPKTDDVELLYRLPWTILTDVQWGAVLFASWKFLSNAFVPKSIGYSPSAGVSAALRSLEVFIWHHVQHQTERLDSAVAAVLAEEGGPSRDDENLWHLPEVQRRVPLDIPSSPAMAVLQSVIAGRISNKKDAALATALAHVLVGVVGGASGDSGKLDRRNALSLAQFALWDAELDGANLTLRDIVASPLGPLINLFSRRGDFVRFSSIMMPPNNGLSKKVGSAISALDTFVESKYRSRYHNRPMDVGSVFSELYFRPSKSIFMVEQIKAATSKRIGSLNMTICEIGFMYGGSAVGWLELIPDARLISFDLGPTAGNPLPEYGAEFIAQAYGPRAEFHWGNSMQTIPGWVANQTESKSGVWCDVVLLDGCKDLSCRDSDFRHILQRSHPGAVIFIDDVDPSVMSESAAHSDPTLALRRWVEEGLLTELECFEPFSYDIRYNFEGRYGDHFRNTGICRAVLVTQADVVCSVEKGLDC